MNTVKRLIMIAAIGTLSVLTVGLVLGSMEGALAAPPSPTMDAKVINSVTEPVPVAPQGTTNVSGSVSVSDWPTSTLPVVQQGTVDVSGTVGLSDNTVKLDPAGNTVKLDAASSVAVSGTVGLSDNTVMVGNWPTSALPVSQQGTVDVSGTVGLSDNTVKLDPAGNTVKLDSTSSVAVSGTVGLSDNTVKLDPSSNTVKIDSTGSMPVSGTVGLADGATVRIDHSYTNSNPVKVWGWTALDPVSENRVRATNWIDPETHQAVPLLVQVAGGGNSAQQPVQFRYTTADTSTVAYTVPAGKVLKIEYVSVFAETNVEYPQANVETTIGGVTMQHVLPVLESEHGSELAFNPDRYRVSAQVTFYAEENTNVRALVRGAMGGFAGGAEFMFSGYLTDK